MVFLVACLWRSGPWNDSFVGARSRWGVRAWHQRRELEAPLCQLCCANLRVRVKSAGESSPAPRKARAQPQLSELPWGTDVATRPSRHHEGAGNLQRSRGALSVTKAPRYKGPRTLSGSLVFEGSLFFSFE